MRKYLLQMLCIACVVLLLIPVFGTAESTMSLSDDTLEIYLNDKTTISVNNAVEGYYYYWQFAGAVGSGGFNSATGDGYPYGKTAGGTGTATLTVYTDNSKTEQVAGPFVCDITVKDVVARVNGTEYGTDAFNDAVAAAKNTEYVLEMYSTGSSVTLSVGDTLKVKAADNRGKGSVTVKAPAATADGAYVINRTTDDNGVTTYTCEATDVLVEFTPADGSAKTYSTSLSIGSKAGTYKLLGDISNNNRTSVLGTGIVLDLNGHTINFATGTTYPAILLGSSAKTGGLTIQDSVGGGKIVNSGSYAVWASQRSSNVVINGGEISAGVHAVYTSNGSTATINGGTFKVTGSDKRYVINCEDNNKNTITVNGGTFYDFNPEDNTADGEHTNYVAAGKTVLVGSDGGSTTYTIVDSVVVTFDADNADDDSDITTVTVAKGSKLEQPTTPTKDGFVFACWRDADTERRWNFTSDTVSEPVTLKAQWIETSDETYTIHYDGNGATSGNDYDQLSVPRTVATRLYVHDFSKQGNRFVGWNTVADGSGDSYEEQAEVVGLAGDGETVTLYAQWTTEGVYQAENLGNGRYRIPVQMGQTVIIPDLPAGVHYEVREVSMPAGWSFEKAMNGEDDSDQTYSYGVIEANGVASATMVNKYSAAGGLNIVVYKEVIDDMTGEQVDPEAGQFTFELYRVDGASEQKVSASENEQANDYHLGQVRFDAIDFTEEDIGRTYIYKVREINVPEGYEADTDIQVEVTVIDNEDGTLSFSMAMNHMRQDPASPDTVEAKISVFTNRDKRHGKLILAKNVVGSAPAAEDFTFNLTLETPDMEEYTQTISGIFHGADGDVATAWTSASGVYTISLAGGESAEFDLPSGLKYSITENSKPGWQQLGSIGETGSIVLGETQNASFSNSFNTEGVLTLEGTKILTGRELDENEFIFNVKDTATNETVSTGSNQAAEYDQNTNSATAAIKFTAIPYTTDDIGKTFTYEISEYVPSGVDASVTYDSKVYTMTVTVGVSGGEMTFEKSIVDNNGNALGEGDVMTFENEFEDVTEVVVLGEKRLLGRDFRDGDDWTFTVESVNGGPLPEIPAITIQADESNEFEFVFKFSSDDLVETDDATGEQTRLTTKDFEYTITESGLVPGVLNDLTPKHVKIRLTSLSGHVSARVLPDESDELVWHNKLDGAKLPGTGSMEAIWFVLAGLCVIAIGLIVRRRLLHE